MKLEIELVPEGSWYTNLRSKLSRADWDKVRNKCYKKAKYKCELCGETGDTHPVECHEIWEYNDMKRIQKLKGTIALCPDCHMVKHAGLAIKNGKQEAIIQQLIKVNGITRQEAINHMNDAFKQWAWRSEYIWTIDMGKFSK